MDIELRLLGEAGAWERLSVDEKATLFAFWSVDRRSQRLFPFEEVTSG